MGAQNIVSAVDNMQSTRQCEKEGGTKVWLREENQGEIARKQMRGYFVVNQMKSLDVQDDLKTVQIQEDTLFFFTRPAVYD